MKIFDLNQPVLSKTTTSQGPRQREVSGPNQERIFYPGDTVYAQIITLADGRSCWIDQCYLENAPTAGSFYNGVRNPDPAEVPERSQLKIFDLSQPIPTKATTSQVQRQRVATGQNQTARFIAGDTVWGSEIVLDDGRVCSGNCYLPSTPGAGTVRTGVINPWSGEVPASTPTWDPNVQTRPRWESSPGQLLGFRQGDAVWARWIQLDGGRVCDDSSGCYMASAPESGILRDGVTNPFPGEVPREKLTYPWP